MQVNVDRLWSDLEQLGSIGKNPEDGGVTRIAFSQEDMEAKKFIKKLTESAGMQVNQDDVGNVIGRLRGMHEKPSLVVGSHTDTVPFGGRFDGALGFLAGVECARVIKESQYKLRHSLEVISFSDEEGYRFGRGTMGSRAISGFFNPDDLHELKEKSGATLWQVLRDLGFGPNRIGLLRREQLSILAYLELHIEQGPVLDSLGIPIGIVDSIAGILRYKLKLKGEPNHAGTTPMEYRKDALVAAAMVVTTVRDSIRKYGGKLVGTVGSFEVFPGAPNIVPGLVVMTIELRGPSQQVLDEAAKKILSLAHEACDLNGVSFEAKETVHNEPTSMHPKMIHAIEDKCRKMGVSYRRMYSGAGHDAMWMAKRWPTGMIFVPSAGGVSHSPQEFTNKGHVGLGAQVLLETILRLDQEEAGKL